MFLRRRAAAGVARISRGGAIWTLGVQHSPPAEVQSRSVSKGVGAPCSPSVADGDRDVHSQDSLLEPLPRAVVVPRRDFEERNGQHAALRVVRARQEAVARVPFSRGHRVSTFAACNVRGFVAWRTTRDTFTRRKFHRAFVSSVLKLLNPWPLPRPILVLDNACIHMHAELEAAVHACGAIVLFLPPYCPQFNPIEVMFGQLKRWLARHANLAFAFIQRRFSRLPCASA